MMTTADEERTHVPPPSDTIADQASGDTPTAVATDSRNLGALAHLSGFVTFAGVPGFIGPLIVWLLQRDHDEFVAEQAREALNFNLSLLLYVAAGVAISILTIGLGLVLVVPAAIVGAVAWLALTVVAALRAADGRTYRYPLTLRFVV